MGLFSFSKIKEKDNKDDDFSISRIYEEQIKSHDYDVLTDDEEGAINSILQEEQERDERYEKPIELILQDDIRQAQKERLYSPIREWRQVYEESYNDNYIKQKSQSLKDQNNSENVLKNITNPIRSKFIELDKKILEKYGKNKDFDNLEKKVEVKNEYVSSLAERRGKKIDKTHTENSDNYIKEEFIKEIARKVLEEALPYIEDAKAEKTRKKKLKNETLEETFETTQKNEHKYKDVDDNSPTVEYDEEINETSSVESRVENQSLQNEVVNDISNNAKYEEENMGNNIFSFLKNKAEKVDAVNSQQENTNGAMPNQNIQNPMETMPNQSMNNMGGMQNPMVGSMPNMSMAGSMQSPMRTMPNQGMNNVGGMQNPMMGSMPNMNMAGGMQNPMGATPNQGMNNVGGMQNPMMGSMPNMNMAGGMQNPMGATPNQGMNNVGGMQNPMMGSMPNMNMAGGMQNPMGATPNQGMNNIGSIQYQSATGAQTMDKTLNQPLDTIVNAQAIDNNLAVEKNSVSEIVFEEQNADTESDNISIAQVTTEENVVIERAVGEPSVVESVITEHAITNTSDGSANSENISLSNLMEDDENINSESKIAKDVADKNLNVTGVNIGASNMNPNAAVGNPNVANSNSNVAGGRFSSFARPTNAENSGIFNNQVPRFAGPVINTEDPNVNTATNAILQQINMSTSHIVEKLNGGGDPHADLNRVSPALYYKNMKYSVTSLIIALLAGILALFSCVSIISGIAAKNIAMVPTIINYIFIMLLSVCSVLLSLKQKKLFFSAKKLKEYLSAKCQANDMARLGFIISLTTIIFSIIMLVTSIVIAVVVI